jgi:hypothetical protein
MADCFRVDVHNVEVGTHDHSWRKRVQRGSDRQLRASRNHADEYAYVLVGHRPNDETELRMHFIVARARGP